MDLEHVCRAALVTPLAGLMLTLGPAQAAEPARPAVDVPDVLMARLAALYPSTRIDAVTPSELPGLFQVVMGRNMAYVDASGRYFLFGHVWDMAQRKDLTAERLAAVDRIMPGELPRELAIVSVHGTGRRVLHVIADPQCGYCKQLEQSLADVPDLTVVTYLLPILGPESQRLASHVWCAADRRAAWSDWMVRGVSPPAPDPACDVPLDAWARMGQQLGVRATPALFSADGRRHAGAMAPAELLAWLEATTPAVQNGHALRTTGPVPAPKPRATP